MTIDRRILLTALGTGVLGLGLGACGSSGSGRSAPVNRVQSRGPFPEISFADWTDAEPGYLLYPGDEIDIVTPTAPELNRQLRIAPDGRIAMPLIGQLMAADRSIPELEMALVNAYAEHLVRPEAEVTLRQAQPLKVWVDGEVRTPGVYDMAGDIDAYQAIVQAGGFLPTARRQEVALIRRGPGGLRMMRALDLRPRQGEVVALRRSDILFVPRTTLGELAVFFGQIRDALPIGFNYTINGQYQQL
jgi:protein involved in polysaccharide export with SLBB domain